MSECLTETDIRKLLKLLDKLRTSKTVTSGQDTYAATERSVISVIAQWVKWYGRDELSMDL
jgi:hypothetical protein